jgi:amidase
LVYESCFVASLDFLSASALEQARLVRTGALSSVELTRAYLARIERIDGGIHAFVQVLAPRALRHARGKDDEAARARRSGSVDRLPAFHGVPVGVKDLNFVRGTFSRMGSRAFKYFWSPVDDKMTAQLRRGGFVILGKLATAEFGALPVTETELHGPTHNPWNLGVTCGGSSGGSGAAVAAGLLPIAQGSDGAGSIRIPSAFCHLYGIKPSRGRVVNPYGRPDRTALATTGPLARTVEDAAAMLDVMAGLTVGAPHWAPPPLRPYAELMHDAPKRLRIRVATRSPIVDTHPEIAAGIRRVAKILEGLGHDVEEGTMPEATIAEFLPLWQHFISRLPGVRWSLAQPTTRWLATVGRLLRDEDVHARHEELSRRVEAWFGDADLWLTPTVACPPPAIGAWSQLAPEDAFLAAAPIAAFTALFNVSGQPAASVPAGLTSAGLPFGAQLAGRPLDDATVIAVSRQLELAMPWAERPAPCA